MVNPSKHFPLLVTSRLDETRVFYKEVAGFSTTLDTDGYLQVRSGEAVEAPELCFMAPDAMPGAALPPFSGHGLIVSIPVANADEKARALQAAGAVGVGEVSDKPWGWRSFVVPDPNGLLLDFFHETAEASTMKHEAS